MFRLCHAAATELPSAQKKSGIPESLKLHSFTSKIIASPVLFLSDLHVRKYTGPKANRPSATTLLITWRIYINLYIHAGRNEVMYRVLWLYPPCVEKFIPHFWWQEDHSTFDLFISVPNLFSTLPLFLTHACIERSTKTLLLYWAVVLSATRSFSIYESRTRGSGLTWVIVRRTHQVFLNVCI